MRLFAILLLCLTLAACGETYHPDSQPSTKEAGQWHGRVYIPDALNLNAAHLLFVLDEVDTTQALNSSTTTPGLPSGWNLIVRSAPYWHTVSYGQTPILVNGHTNYYKKNLFVVYAGQGPPYLPALSHEIAHVYDGPGANH